MSEWLITYAPLVSQALLQCGFAFSQYVVLRAGVFSVATAGFASLGAYAAALLTMRLGVPALVSVCASALVGALAGALISIPLARLRGVFQAIATLAFVQIVQSLTLFVEPMTGGALGLNGIPQAATTMHLAIVLAGLAYLLHVIGKLSIGRAFDAARQDEMVAVSLGISVVRLHALAFTMSGAIGGLVGGLYAFNRYSIVPEQFGFALLVASLAAVVLGGRISVFGPIVGAVVLTLLPELGRPLADQRYLLHGGLLMLAITFLPDGIVDAGKFQWKRRFSADRAGSATAVGSHGTPSH